MVITIKCKQGKDVDVLIDSIINNSKSLLVSYTSLVGYGDWLYDLLDDPEINCLIVDECKKIKGLEKYLTKTKFRVRKPYHEFSSKVKMPKNIILIKRI